MITIKQKPALSPAFLAGAERAKQAAAAARVAKAQSPSKSEKRVNAVTPATPSLAELQKLPVHPIAGMFPMLAEDELAELAADIAENGVNHPIVISRDGKLIDGRNRLAACVLAKVEPPVTYFEGDDPAAFIISENVNRRHLSKSQRAMAVAKAFPQPEKGGRGKNSFAAKEFSVAALSKARTVLRLAPDLADQVLAGFPTLEDAYKQASLRKSESEQKADRLRAIAKANPEIAEAVSNGALSLDEAKRRIEEAEKEHKQLRWAATKNICDAVMMLDRPVDNAADAAALFDPAIADQGGHTVTPERLRKVADYASALASAFEDQQEN